MENGKSSLTNGTGFYSAE